MHAPWYTHTSIHVCGHICTLSQVYTNLHPFSLTTMYFSKLSLSKLHLCVCSRVHLCIMCAHVSEYSSGFALMDDQLWAWSTKWAAPWQWAVITWTYVCGSTTTFWLYLKPPAVWCYLFHNNNTLYLAREQAFQKYTQALSQCGWQVLFWFLTRWRVGLEQRQMLR